MIFRNFSDASQIVHKLKLRGKNHWANYCKSGEKPVDIPSNAARTYKEEWKGWGDWLGTRRILVQDKQYLSFEEARKYVNSISLRGYEIWVEYSKSGNITDQASG